jgi:DnaJ family protein C protein 13
VLVAAQAMVTGDPALVSMSAALLEEVVRHNNEALPRLYETGVFFFALAYSASNLVEVGRLLEVRSRLCWISTIS